MIWTNQRPHQIHPTLNSLRRVPSTPNQANQYIQPPDWKIVGSIISFMVLLLLTFFTIVGVPVVLTQLKSDDPCSILDNQSTHTRPTWTVSTTPDDQSKSKISHLISDQLNHLCIAFKEKRRICMNNARWDTRGKTLANQMTSTATNTLWSLKNPKDLTIIFNDTLLIADSGNNRVLSWNLRTQQADLIAGTGAYGSWFNLLARPMALAILNNHLFVSDVDNYRIQKFSLSKNTNDSYGLTLIGRHGRGSNLNQINSVTSLLVPLTRPNFLFLSDTNNHRVLLADTDLFHIELFAGQSDSPGSDLNHLNGPAGLAYNEQRESLYVADRLNHRIQKYHRSGDRLPVTVAGFGELSHPSAVKLDPNENHMFIADTGNHRIVLWLDGARMGRTIAGDGTPGTGSSQLNSPVQLDFDDQYNLYVVDENNHRIQRFDLLHDGC